MLSTTDSDSLRFLFGVVETEPPYRCRSLELDAVAMDFGFWERRDLLEEYRRRLEADDWSEQGEQAMHEVSLPAWYLRRGGA